MRLIDADKLVKAIENENPGMSISGAIEKFARTAQVNMQPTVDAIPIEWIKKWCNEHNRKSLEERLLKRYGVITMLEDWGKENDGK